MAWGEGARHGLGGVGQGGAGWCRARWECGVGQGMLVVARGEVGWGRTEAELWLTLQLTT